MTARRKQNSYDSGARAKLKSHEQICTERYGAIERRLGRIEKVIISVAGMTILTLVGALWTLINAHFH